MEIGGDICICSIVPNIRDLVIIFNPIGIEM